MEEQTDRAKERGMIYRMQIPLLHFNVLWPDSEGGKSLTKLLLQSSTFFSPLAPRPPSPRSHTDPILSVGGILHALMLHPAVSQYCAFDKKMQGALLLKEVKNPFICP
uniref:Uncharacterized protein n=1 Tax=Amphilophus citrinellus TaxID=61819 RepID=A0A3Q0SHP8_AMPCI